MQVLGLRQWALLFAFGSMLVCDACMASVVTFLVPLFGLWYPTQDWQLTSSHCVSQNFCSLHHLEFDREFLKPKVHSGSAAT